MKIDKCNYSFAKLTGEHLPDYLNKLRNSKTYSMQVFAEAGVGARTILNDQLKKKNDFSGCYVLYDGHKPIYVGISRTLVQRLTQHVKGKSHYDASLAYRIAKTKFPHNLTRNEAMANIGFCEEFSSAKKYISDLSVRFIEIENPVELYLFEVYCAMELGTCDWNSFETH